MKFRVFEPLHLDVEAFAKEGASLEGGWPVERLDRLRQSSHAERGVSESDVVAWRAEGERRDVRGVAQTWLHVRASVSIALECQRCLTPVQTLLAVERSFLFVQGEDAAAELDAEGEDDVLAMTRALNLPELIEDELLLELPLVPRHETCPQPLRHTEPELPGDQAPHPFAGLAALKRGNLPN